ncbi:hypothetical protein [Deinococcus sp. Leaf326]|uniref:hypothetical protein n=1 Tax=Deinococcus sp. Leaf326 TaxID=1736338 RepID=UPI0006FB3080|nr:hypothetical protein [Deinococcus sp. Leaf326]KQR22914.1 hypothetical protein ASF71_07030 [Deinococcus sp. Leaf326]
MTTLSDGTYTWDFPTGGTLGPATYTAIITGGRVTTWRSTSADGQHVMDTRADDLAQWGDNYAHALRAEIDLRERVGYVIGQDRVQFVAARRAGAA